MCVVVLPQIVEECPSLTPSKQVHTETFPKRGEALLAAPLFSGFMLRSN